MPVVLEMNRPKIEKRIEAAAAYLGIDGGIDGFFEYVLKLRENLGIPATLTKLGVGVDRIDEMAEMALEDLCAGGNPVEIRENTRALFVACL